MVLLEKELNPSSHGSVMLVLVLCQLVTLILGESVVSQVFAPHLCSETLGGLSLQLNRLICSLYKRKRELKCYIKLLVCTLHHEISALLVPFFKTL